MSKKIKRITISSMAAVLTITNISSSLTVFAAEDGFTITYDSIAKELTSEKKSVFEITDAMPGDVFTKEITLYNKDGIEPKLYLKIDDSKANLSDKELTLANDTTLTISIDKGDGNITKAYDGSLSGMFSSKRAEALFLGKVDAGKQEKVIIELQLPTNLDNSFTLTEINLNWQFSAEEDKIGVCETPVITPKSRSYYAYEKFEHATITCATPNAVIHYTIDGSEPTSDSPIYTEPILIDHDFTIKAMATAVGLTNSMTASESYEIKTPVCETPVITPKSREYYEDEEFDHATITCPTQNSIIYYTIDGSEPTPNSTVYTEPILIDHDFTIKAIATATGYTNSKTASESYKVKVPLPVCQAPIITPESGIYPEEVNVIVTCPEPNSTIHYTLDGTEPTIDSPVYTEPLNVKENTIVKAIAVAPRRQNSVVITNEYQIKLKKPKIKPNGDLYEDEYLKIKITHPDPDVTIYYTTNGKTPTKENAKIYEGPFEIDVNTTVKAIAVAENKIDSDVSKEDYELKTVPPKIYPASGDYKEPVSVTIKCKDIGAKIYYTTDGSKPTDKSKLYKGAFIVEDSCIVKAIAINPDKSPSDVVKADYNINAKLAPPDINPESGTYTDSIEVKITTDTEDATIHYTLDGKNPTEKSPIYKKPIIVEKSTVVKACVTKEGYNDSDTNSKIYEIKLEAPSITPDSGQYDSNQTIVINNNSKNPNAKVYYYIGDINDSTSAENVEYTEYKGPFTIEKSSRIIAITRAPGVTDSDIVMAQYSIEIPVPVEETPPPEEPEGPTKTGVESDIKTNRFPFAIIGIISSLIAGAVIFKNKKKR